jgi:hypothetical protein
LIHMRDMVWSKHTEMWTAGTWYLHHDSAPAHRLLVDSRVVDKASDSCPSTTYIFTWCTPLNFPVHHTKNDCETNISNGTEPRYRNKDKLRAFQRTFFRQCFRTCKTWWEECIHAQENHSGGDKCN